MKIDGIKTANDARQALVGRIVQMTKAFGEKDFAKVQRESQMYDHLRQHAAGMFGIDTAPYDNTVKQITLNLN